MAMAAALLVDIASRRHPHDFEADGERRDLGAADQQPSEPDDLSLALSQTSVDLLPAATPPVELVTMNLRHVADKATLHLHLKREKTKCDLWASVWSTARVLSEMLLADAKEHLAEAKTIEIGAGTALCSMVAACAGARVTVTDSSEMSLDLVRESGKLNGIDESSLTTQRLDWHTLASAKDEAPPSLKSNFDLLLGSDVLFLRANVNAVLGTVARCVRPGGLAVIICPGRPSSIDFKGEVEDHSELEVESFEMEETCVTETRLLKLVRLYLITVRGAPPSPRTLALKRSLLEAWVTVDARSARPGAKYEYTEALAGDEGA